MYEHFSEEDRAVLQELDNLMDSNPVVQRVKKRRLEIYERSPEALEKETESLAKKYQITPDERKQLVWRLSRGVQVFENIVASVLDASMNGTLNFRFDVWQISNDIKKILDNLREENSDIFKLGGKLINFPGENDDS